MFGLSEWMGRRPFDLISAFPSLFEEEGFGEFPLLNLWAGDEEMEVTAELPGISPEKLDISVSGDVLTIKGEREITTESKDAEWLRRERIAGSFTRSLKLPFHIAADKVRADYSNGVLRLTLPRVEEEKPRRIAVSVS